MFNDTDLGVACQNAYYAPYYRYLEPAPTGKWYDAPPCSYSGLSTMLRKASRDVVVFSHLK